MQKTIIISILSMILGGAIYAAVSLQISDQNIWVDTAGENAKIENTAWNELINRVNTECTTDNGGRCFVASDSKSSLDGDLLAGNIKQGVNIFGIDGTYHIKSGVYFVKDLDSGGAGVNYISNCFCNGDDKMLACAHGVGVDGTISASVANAENTAKSSAYAILFQDGLTSCRVNNNAENQTSGAYATACFAICEGPSTTSPGICQYDGIGSSWMGCYYPVNINLGTVNCTDTYCEFTNPRIFNYVIDNAAAGRFCSELGMSFSSSTTVDLSGANAYWSATKWATGNASNARPRISSIKCNK